MLTPLPVVIASETLTSIWRNPVLSPGFAYLAEHDDEEPKIEEANYGVKTTPRHMALLSSSADAAKTKQNENQDNAAKSALMDAFDAALHNKGGHQH
ncbi:predicted protein [Coccidioides posadasii str. Silveira]|uniref:Predicted protein n=1 Tax=Coccidioides posadasii (strain RMSCC 757 / Silveira) TaxID=443226 RepID=E9CS11_COCPS|nr:predicted protein [Coccidioides posadasii str. Silveira]